MHKDPLILDRTEDHSGRQEEPETDLAIARALFKRGRAAGRAELNRLFRTGAAQRRIQRSPSGGYSMNWSSWMIDCI
jgi:hypothetical protein